MTEEKKEIVIYGNELNNIILHDMTQKDLNVFMYCCFIAAGKGTNILELKYNILKKISGNKNLTDKEFHEILDQLSDKLLLARYYEKNEDRTKFARFVLFQTFEGDLNTKILKFQVGEKWSYLLNDVTANFSMLDMKNYISIKGKYAKEIYRHLSQYRKNGWWYIDIDKFRVLMSIPTNMIDRNIQPKIIKPALIKLNPYFESLNCTTVKNESKKGNPIIGFKFEFEKIKDEALVEENAPETISVIKESKMKKNTKPANNNRFHNFNQREYSDEFFWALERGLANK